MYRSGIASIEDKGMLTARDIIGRWPSAEELARDLGLKAVTVRQWRNRQSIPAEYWQMMIELGERRGIAVTLEELAEVAAGRLAARALVPKAGAE